MYWQKRFDRENPDQKIEEEMLKIREKTYKLWLFTYHKGIAKSGISCKQKEGSTFDSKVRN